MYSRLTTFFALSLLILQSSVSAQDDQFLRIAPGGHMSEIWEMELDSKNRILTTGEDKTLKVWNSEEGYLEREFLGQIGLGMDGINYALGLSSDDKYLAIGGWMGNTDGSDDVGHIRLYDYQTGKLLHLYKGHIEVVMGLEFIDNTHILISADANGNMVATNLDNGDFVILPYISGELIDLEVRGNYYYTAEENGLVKMWDLTNPKKPKAIFDKPFKEGALVHDIAVDQMTGRVAVGSGTTLYILNEKLKEEDFYINGTYDPIKALAFSPSGDRIAIVTENNSDEFARVKVYDNMGGYWQANGAFSKHKEFVGCVEFIDEEKLVTAGGLNYEVAIWKSHVGKKTTTVLHWMEGVGTRVERVSMKDHRIAFSRVQKKKNEVPFDYVFDLIDRKIVPYDSTYHFPEAVREYNGIRGEKNESGTTLFIKKGNQTLGSYTRARNEGYFHMDFTFFREYVISASNFGYIQVYDFKGTKKSDLVGQQGSISDLTISSDSLYLITSSDDQTICIWPANELGKKSIIYPLATLFIASNNEWVIWNREGYFTASKKGASYVGYHLNQGEDKEAKFYPFEQFDIKYNRPDIILEKLGVVDSGIIQLYKSAYLKRLQRMGISESDLSGKLNLPQLTLTPWKNENGQLNLSVTATDSVYAIRAFQVYVNDVPVFGRQGIRLEKPSHQIEQKIETDLMSGLNKIQISAINTAGVESLKETFTVNNNTPSNSDLYIVSMGVSHYQDSSYNLDYAAKDAEDVANLFGASTHYKDIKKRLLTDEHVTRQTLAELKQFLSTAKPDDVVILFVAGHGVLNTSLDYFYCTYDMDFKSPEKFGVSYSELEILFDGIKAIRKLLIMDTCHSGEVDKNDLEELTSAASEESDITFRTAASGTTYREAQGLKKTNEAVKEMFNDLRRGTGATVISSAGGAEFAMESEQWKNGLFTYCLLEGIQSKSADLDQNGQIFLSELQAYIAVKVDAISGGRQMPTSRFENISLDYRIW